jgi:hypothetical protein
MISSGRQRPGGKIAGFSASEEPAARMKSSALDSAFTALSPDGALKLSLIFGRDSPLHSGPALACHAAIGR